VKSALAALACLFLAAHLPFLPPGLEDIDSVNFALGVRDFDVARHQPHPPGYPVYIALSKASAAILGGAGSQRAVVSALAVWSAVSGAAAVFLLFALFRAIDGSDRRAWWATGIAVASPLFWFTALRPLSDMTGLAAAVAAQVLLLSVLTGGLRPAGPPTSTPARTEHAPGTPNAVARGVGPDMRLITGACIAGIAAGIRAQTVVLTAPILIAALVLPRPGVTLRIRIAALLAATAGVIVWALPLLLASGGPGGYLAALGSQAGEDFSGVSMLWTTRTPRVAVDAVMYTFLWPWGGLVLGGIVLAAAVIGALRLLRLNPRALLWLAIGFGPYALFHLLFHETATVRYALPLVPPVAFLTAAAFDWPGPRAAMVLSTALIVISLDRSARAARAYDRVEAPAFQALRAVSADHSDGRPVSMHAVFRRASEWIPPGSRVLRPPHGREWLALIEHWRAQPGIPIAFVGDPRRTDLALFDPRARDLKGSYRWAFPELPYVGGTRPGNADWYVMRPPGWMLDRGWALSAEIGGVSARDAAGPHLQPSVAWVRARGEPALLLIGGRNLGATAPAHLIVSRGDTVLDRWEAGPGFFFRKLPIVAGTLNGDGYVPLSVRAAGGPSQPVSLEQFDLQPDGVEMAGFAEGWQEPEFNATTARAWRWMSERAVVWARPIAADVTLTMSGESPLRYFDSAPTVRVSIHGQELARFSPADDFTQDVRLPASLLEAAEGRVVIESDRWFVPAERGGSADRRHLALRIYQLRVKREGG
jgi:hypothetical protein